MGGKGFFGFQVARLRPYEGALRRKLGIDWKIRTGNRWLDAPVPFIAPFGQTRPFVLDLSKETSVATAGMTVDISLAKRLAKSISAIIKADKRNLRGEEKETKKLSVEIAKGDKSANFSRPRSVAALGIKKGDEVRIYAYGKNQREALSYVNALLGRNGFAETGSTIEDETYVAVKSKAKDISMGFALVMPENLRISDYPSRTLLSPDEAGKERIKVEKAFSVIGDDLTKRLGRDLPESIDIIWKIFRFSRFDCGRLGFALALKVEEEKICVKDAIEKMLEEERDEKLKEIKIKIFELMLSVISNTNKRARKEIEDKKAKALFVIVEDYILDVGALCKDNVMCVIRKKGSLDDWFSRVLIRAGKRVAICPEGLKGVKDNDAMVFAGKKRFSPVIILNPNNEVRDYYMKLLSAEEEKAFKASQAAPLPAPKPLTLPLPYRDSIGEI